MDPQDVVGLDRMALAGRLTRREVLRRALTLGLATPAVAALLAACGNSAATSAPNTGAGAPAGR